MRAQSFALENVSGNIANSQTTAFKRMDTSFVDLIPIRYPPSSSPAAWPPTRAQHSVQGDIQANSIGTFMAINGDGFFVVGKPSSVDSTTVRCSTASSATPRRGDFQPTRMASWSMVPATTSRASRSIRRTGNLVGSVPQLLQFQNDFLPAQQTTQIDYRANLASYPLTQAHDTSIPRSELIDPVTLSANPIAGAPVAPRSPASVPLCRRDRDRHRYWHVRDGRHGARCRQWRIAAPCRHAVRRLADDLRPQLSRHRYIDQRGEHHQHDGWPVQRRGGIDRYLGRHQQAGSDVGHCRLRLRRQHRLD
jgi:hypothetical protein